MDDKNTMLIIANIFIAMSFIVRDAIGWIFMFGIGMIWFITFMHTTAKEIEQKKRMIMRMEIIHEILHEIMENHKRSEKKSTRRKR